MTDTNGSEPRRTTPRWLYGVLIASLAANLLVVGSAAGAMWAHRHGHKRFGGEHGLVDFINRLPGEKQPGLREALLSEREKLKPLREAVRTSWGEANTALGEEPFDKERFKAALTRAQENETRVREAINLALAELAGKLNAEERKALKEWREHRAKGWRKHRWSRDGD